MNTRSKPTWALVTDSGYGRLVELERSPPRITEIGTREAATRHQTSRELTTDASGRDFDTAGPVSHSKAPRTDAHDEAERQFVERWSRDLQQAFTNGRFRQLLLVADPRTLGRLRKTMAEKLRSAVLAESDRDLTKLPLQDLEPRLRELAGWSHS